MIFLSISYCQLLKVVLIKSGLIEKYNHFSINIQFTINFSTWKKMAADDFLSKIIL